MQRKQLAIPGIVLGLLMAAPATTVVAQRGVVVPKPPPTVVVPAIPKPLPPLPSPVVLPRALPKPALPPPGSFPLPPAAPVAGPPPGPPTSGRENSSERYTLPGVVPNDPCKDAPEKCKEKGLDDGGGGDSCEELWRRIELCRAGGVGNCDNDIGRYQQSCQESSGAPAGNVSQQSEAPSSPTESDGPSIPLVLGGVALAMTAIAFALRRR